MFNMTERKNSTKVNNDLLSIGFVGLIICINFNKITQEEINSKSIILLFIGCLLSIFSIFVNGLAWKQLIKWLGYKDFCQLEGVGVEFSGSVQRCDITRARTLRSKSVI